MNKLIRTGIAWTLFASLPASAFVTAPETAQPWEYYTISWTDTGVNTCDGQSYPWAYQITETDMTGAYPPRNHEISSPSEKSISLRNGAGLYLYSVKVRYCSNSSWPKGAYERFVGYPEVVITAPTYYEYDALGRLKKVDDDYNGDRVYQYDAAGNRTRLDTN